MQLVIGRIAGVHGVRGEVAVEVRTDDPASRFAAGATLDTEPGSTGPLTVRTTRWHGSRLLIRFAEVPDRTAAERLRGMLLIFDSAELSPSEQRDEWNDHELIELAVADVAGGIVGTIVDVLHLPGQEVLVVRLLSGSEALVPFVAAIVPEVDPDAGRVTIDPPPGLIDDGQDE